MKDIKPSLIIVPTLVGIVCTAVLAGINLLTQPAIREAGHKAEILAARLVLPEGFTEPAHTNFNGVDCFASFDKDTGEILGLAIEGVTQKGYGGEIRLMAGFANGVVHNFKIIEARGETPGLGTKIKSDVFRLPLLNRKIGADWRLKKDGGELDAITSATISSRAALAALRDAIEKHNAAVGKK